MKLARAISLLLLVLLSFQSHAQRQVVRIGTKNFTEQEILGEIIAQLIERTTDLRVERRFGLGGTDICHAAMLAGNIDIYPEYTGTGLLNVLKQTVINDPHRAFRVVAGEYRDRYGLEWLPPIGFNNTYAITVRREDAETHGWDSIDDLAPLASDLKAGFTSEFMERPDGYPGLKQTYGLTFGGAVDLDPGLMYEALASGQVDVICAFATDGRIAEYGLVPLADTRSFFPPYDAAPVVRGETIRVHPELRDLLTVLAGTISDQEMRRMNAEVDVHKRSPAAVAKEWVDSQLGGDPPTNGTSAGKRAKPLNVFELAWKRRSELAQKSIEHLVLTALGTLIAILLGIPLGVLVHSRAAMRGPVLAATEIVQTIPSLAMLAFLFALYGLLGTAPAVTALVLYALLPIVLNTYTGLREVPARVIQAAESVGMTSWQRLRIIELPLAAPVIIAGIRAATVLTVGIATLSTYIGAGGLGDFIARGLARNDTRLTLLGAVPAAIMAVTLSLFIRWGERAMKQR